MVGSTPRCRMTCAKPTAPDTQVPVGGVEPHRKETCCILLTTAISVSIYVYIYLYLIIDLYYAIIYIDIGLCRNHSKNDHVSLLCIIVWAAQTSVAIEDIICSRFIVARRKKHSGKYGKVKNNINTSQRLPYQKCGIKMDIRHGFGYDTDHIRPYFLNR